MIQWRIRQSLKARREAFLKTGEPRPINDEQLRGGCLRICTDDESEWLMFPAFNAWEWLSTLRNEPEHEPQPFLGPTSRLWANGSKASSSSSCSTSNDDDNDDDNDNDDNKIS
ncbi:hypothetical protein F66182_5385 [Fusarium sp. NRRL 66182]|nr:hypothetical protein F66182_5385 [Fusarium sp. NRRL 66182]